MNATKRGNPIEKETIEEEDVLDHCYFGEMHPILFQILTFLTVIDIASFQTFFQLILLFMVILMLSNWIFHQGQDYHEILKIYLRQFVFAPQLMMIIQLTLIYVFNIPDIAQKFDKNGGIGRILSCFGIFFENQIDIDKTKSFMLSEYTLNYNTSVIALILPL